MGIDTAFVKTLLEIQLDKLRHVFDLPESPMRHIEELQRDEVFLDSVNARVLRNDAFRTRKFHSIYEFGVYRNLLFALIRAVRPQCIIETGVLHGLTSTWMLQALHLNGSGEMVSIDLPRRDWETFFPGQPMSAGAENEFELPDEEEPGWIVPEHLRHRWEIVIGPSNPLLEKTLETRTPDLFVHDSDHSYELMEYECNMALRSNPNAYIVVDNSDDNDFINDFLHQNSFDYLFMDDADHDNRVRPRTSVCRLKNAQPLVPTNRRWQNHLTSKGVDGFLYDRLSMFALNPPHAKDVFKFPVHGEHDDELSRWWFEWMEEFPYHVYIEPTNVCNLHCRMCVNDSLTRKRGAMKQELFQKIVDEIAEKRPQCYIHLYGIGEPLVDPGILDKLEYALQTKGLKNLWLGTNGQALLDNDIYKRCVDLGAPIIGVDMSGMSAETHEAVHRGSSFEKIKKSIESLYAYVRSGNAKTRVELAYIVNPGVNDQDIEAFTQWCGRNGYEYKLVGLHGWTGSVDGVAPPTQRTTPCRAQWEGMMINWNGLVSTCFQDADASETFGDLSDRSIQEIWQGPLRDRRTAMVNGDFPGLCADCTSFLAPGPPGFRSSLYPNVLQSKKPSE